MQVTSRSAGKEHLHPSKVEYLVMTVDACTIVFSWIFALYCALNFNTVYIARAFEWTFPLFILGYVVICLAVFQAFRMYKVIWRFASYKNLEETLMGNAITLPFAVLISHWMMGLLPISFYLLGFGLQLVFTIAVRFSYRFFLLASGNSRQKHQAVRRLIPTMIIGAGQAGQMLLRDATKQDSDLQIQCFIDDNPNKKGRHIDGVEVFGNREHIMEAVEKYGIETIVFAAPSASARDRKDILQICSETGCTIKVLPSLLDLASRNVTLGVLKNIEMTDLLGRDPIQVDNEEILSAITGKIILVTGGGGSIGSELCRQIAAHSPGQLLIFDIYENAAYEIQQELVRRYPSLHLKVLIGSVRDTRRLNQIFDTYHPEMVFHAAAHKHVPLMEVSPCEAIKNNAIGTYKTAKCAAEHGVERFVLISTDKAVNPTNIMGASKRLCEMIVQSMDYMASHHQLDQLPQIGAAPIHLDPQAPATQFVMVRFGNVLGSNGSVIPLFKKQIEAGGPVTVTHKDIVRYFMTIPEAVSLVLQAAAYANGGEIFVLDMGEQVKIDDLARNLIRLMGYVPDDEIEIVYTGLRPGEKLYEEKLMNDEIAGKTDNALIYIGKPLEFDRERLLQHLPDLYIDALECEEAKVIEEVEAMTGTYHPDWNSFQKNGIHPNVLH